MTSKSLQSKKFKYIAVAILIFFVLAEVSVVLSNDLFFEKVAKKEVAKRSMPVSTANAVKHAYAASLLYSAFRNIFFTENAAKNSTIFLGEVNEVVELFFKSKTDSTLEMMKDLENNLIGIYAAKWLEENPEKTANLEKIGFIGQLAEEEILILSTKNILLSKEKKAELEKSPNFFVAKKWFEENKGAIERKAEEFFVEVEIDNPQASSL